MPGPGNVIPFARALARMGGRSTALERARKGAGGFAKLQQMIREREGIPGDVIPQAEVEMRRNNKEIAKQDEQGEQIGLFGNNPDGSIVDPFEDDPNIKAKQERLHDLTQRVHLSPEQEQEKKRLGDEVVQALREKMGVPGFVQKEGQVEGDFADRGELVSDAPTLIVEQERSSRVEAANRFVADRQNPTLRAADDKENMSDERIAELMANRTGIGAHNPQVEPGTNLVVETLTDKNGVTAGKMSTNPITGHTELLLVPSDHEPSTLVGGLEAFGFPFESRAEAFDALGFVYRDGTPPTKADLEDLFNSSMIDILDTNMDDFLLSNKQLGDFEDGPAS